MASTKQTVQELAAEASTYLVTDQRPNGDDYIRCTDDTPEWVHALIYAAHENGKVGPNDYSYRFTRDALDVIADADNPRRR